MLHHCANNSDFQHENILKRRSKKQNRIVFKKPLLLSKKKVWRSYTNTIKIGRTSFFKIINKSGEHGEADKCTDLCEVCVDSRQAAKMLNVHVNVINNCLEDGAKSIPNINDVHESKESELDTINAQIQKSDHVSLSEKNFVMIRLII